MLIDSSRLHSRLSSIPHVYIRFHVFNFSCRLRSCQRSRLYSCRRSQLRSGSRVQFFTSTFMSSRLQCRNVENVVNVKRKIVLRKQVRNTTRKKENYVVAENIHVFVFCVYDHVHAFNSSRLHSHLS